MPANLYLTRLFVHPRGFAQQAQLRSPDHRLMDNGYLAHSLLGEAFGEHRPKLFALVATRGSRAIYMYGNTPKETLVEHLNAFGDPWVHETFEVDGISQKVMPATLPTTLGIEARLVPIIRRSVNGKAKEHDAYLAARAADSSLTSADKESVYKAWADELFARRGVDVEASVVRQVAPVHLFRRPNGEKRVGVSFERHEIRYAAICKGENLRGLLNSGIGRHKAFGYGMIMLKPPSSIL